MSIEKIEKDERTIFIENKSYKYGCTILNFGLLIDIIYRSIRFNEASWDLFGLLFAGGLVMTVYQYKYKTFASNWKNRYLLLIIATAVLAFLITLLIHKLA